MQSLEKPNEHSRYEQGYESTESTHRRVADEPSEPPPPYDFVEIRSQVQVGEHEAQPARSLPSSPATTVGSPFVRNQSNQRQKIIAIPATTPDLGSPFLRAYPPCLERHGISREPFLAFLDDLNRAAVASPPLQVLDLAGTIVGFVPMATTQIVGTSINAAATLGKVAVSKGRTELCLRRANSEIFGPLGLTAEIGKTAALAQMTGMPVLDSEGKIRKDVSLLQVVTLEQMESYRNGQASLSGQQRRLDALEAYIEFLDLTPLPGLHTPDNPLSKISAFASERERRAGEKKNIKSSIEASEKSQKELLKLERELEEEMTKIEQKYEKDYLSKMARQDEKLETIRNRADVNARDLEKKCHDIEKEKRRIEKEGEKILAEGKKRQEEYTRELRKIEKDRMKDDKEESGMRKILWLIIRSVDENTTSG